VKIRNFLNDRPVWISGKKRPAPVALRQHTLNSGTAPLFFVCDGRGSWPTPKA
jgi:hypothetical protein